ncbi:Panacea domain-containing protein [Sorangium sp. So ce1153]|uniref:Panacea domain-containing protein n=1 Tax=Sorangium sp. So ce1153 TaxID=3133333 RepID=UPI003F5EA9A9
MGDKEGARASAHDVAAYILRRLGSMTAMKLQKLVYYSQAWSLVWDERPVFQEPIKAWANGPVVRELYDEHRGKFMVDEWPAGNPDKLDDKGRETIDSVIKFYGDKSSQWLSDLTHREEPWKAARAGVPMGERGNAEISLGAMMEYYSGLIPGDTSE